MEFSVRENLSPFVTMFMCFAVRQCFSYCDFLAQMMPQNEQEKWEFFVTILSPFVHILSKMRLYFFGMCEKNPKIMQSNFFNFFSKWEHYGHKWRFLKKTAVWKSPFRFWTFIFVHFWKPDLKTEFFFGSWWPGSLNPFLDNIYYFWI